MVIDRARSLFSLLGADLPDEDIDKYTRMTIGSGKLQITARLAGAMWSSTPYSSFASVPAAKVLKPWPLRLE
jgi:hypothetical protein